MTLIEGVGDEVTQFFLLLIVVVVSITAWWSTSITDQPLIRTVLILERRTRRVAVEPPPSPATSRSSMENSIDTGQDQASGSFESPQDLVVEPVCQICNKEENPSASTSQNLNNDDNAQANVISTNNVSEIPTSVEENRSLLLTNGLAPTESNSRMESLNCDSDSQSSVTSLLRNRRLAFFQSRNMTLVEPSGTDETLPSTMNSLDSEDGIQNTSQSNEIHSDEQAGGEPSVGSIRIRLKYLNDDQKLVVGRLQEQLGDFKRRHFGLELAADKFVRLIFKGQVLQSDSETLEGYGLFDNCVVHCLVHQQRNQSEGQTTTTNPATGGQTSDRGTPSAALHRDWDLGNVLFASLSILLGLAWYCRFQYAQLFNATSTMALVGLTGILTVSLVGIYLPDQDGIRHSMGY